MDAMSILRSNHYTITAMEGRWVIGSKVSIGKSLERNALRKDAKGIIMIGLLSRVALHKVIIEDSFVLPKVFILVRLSRRYRQRLIHVVESTNWKHVKRRRRSCFEFGSGACVLACEFVPDSEVSS